jgi:hypothetical protein
MKYNEKLHMAERKKSDFVKPARSENLMFRQQVQTLQETIGIIEKDNEWLLNANNNQNDQFDQEKFKQVKQQIKLRK